MKLSIFVALLVMVMCGTSFWIGRTTGTVNYPAHYFYPSASDLIVHPVPPFEFGDKTGDLTVHSKTGRWYLHNFDVNEETGEISPRGCEQFSADVTGDHLMYPPHFRSLIKGWENLK